MIDWISIGLILVLLLIYFYILRLALRSWNRSSAKKIEDPSTIGQPLFISLIIVVRDEIRYLPALLNSLKNQSLSKSEFEILFVDDHSKDGSLQLLKNSEIDNLHVIDMKDLNIDEVNSFKKIGVQKAVETSSGAVLVFTDGDCVCPPDWLKTVKRKFQTAQHLKALAMPIKIMSRESNILIWWQEMDIAATMVLTNLGISKKWFVSANGANWAVRRNGYLEAVNLDENRVFASGDDIFSIQQIAHNFGAKAIEFLNSKEVIVSTQAQPSLAELYQQRLRWATKETQGSVDGLTILQLLVFLMHFGMVGIFLKSIVLMQPRLFCASLLFFFIKSIIDYRFFDSLKRFFGLRYTLWNFILLEIIYTLYIILLPIMSLFQKKYTWKGREVQ